MMSENNTYPTKFVHTSTPSHAALFFATCVLLATLMMLVYGGKIDSSDELQIVDTATSLARFGDWERDESASIAPSDLMPDSDNLPTARYNDDPLSPLLGALMVILSDSLPRLGTVHALYLLNVLVSALTGGMVMLTGLRLGYAPRVGLALGLLYGVASIAFVYSKTLFREPLVALGLATVTYALLGVQAALQARQWRQLVGQIALLGLAFAFAYAGKASAVFVVPAVGVYGVASALMARGSRRVWSRLSLVLIGLLVLITWALAFSPLYETFVQVAQPVLSRVGASTGTAQTALQVYLFSAGASLWASSPVLLLALLGVLAWAWMGRGALALYAVLCLLGYAFGHALLTSVHWYGGLSWSPRFLVPVVPIMMLGCAPVLERALQLRRDSSWALWGLMSLALVGLSVWIQIVGSLSVWDAYRFLLPPESGGLAEWAAVRNDPSLFAWLVLPATWTSLGLNLAWYRAGLEAWAGGYVVLALGLVAALGVGWWRGGKRGLWLSVGVGGVAWLGITLVGLQSLYQRDREYRADSAGLWQALSLLNEQAQAGDVLVFTDPRYDRFWLNYNRSRVYRPVVLPAQPGEASGQQRPARLQSPDPADLLTSFSLRTLDHLPLHHQRLWLLAHTGDYNPWAVRPIERYLNQSVYRWQELSTGDPEVRLIQYVLETAPPRRGFFSYDYAVPVRYGTDQERIALKGVSLPRGMQYVGGDSVPVVLWWQAETPIQAAYQVALFLAPADASTAPIQAQDSAPQGGFDPTNAWQVGILRQDRRVLALPEHLPAGDYRLWVVLYRWQDGVPVRLGVLEGDRLANTEPPNSVAVLPLTLKIGR